MSSCVDCELDYDPRPGDRGLCPACYDEEMHCEDCGEETNRGAMYDGICGPCAEFLRREGREGRIYAQ